MYNLLREQLEGKRIILLGFGREGKASYKVIRKALPRMKVTIADRDESIRGKTPVTADPHADFILGQEYLDHLAGFDLVIKTPGISLKDLPYPLSSEKITSQTDLFLQAYAKQVIGITGTKGKSTTSSLLYHILQKAGRDAVLLGNIGRPAFDSIDEITPETLIVFELSSHQLEYISKAPHIAILLNLFPEHLDAYKSFLDYQRAKMNILEKQSDGDFFIYNADDKLIRERLAACRIHSRQFPFSFIEAFDNGGFISGNEIIFSREGIKEPVLDLDKKRKLKGDHNLLNIMAVINASRILGLGAEFIREGVAGFTGLEHRLEYTGTVNGIQFYNDSIATIPEACMEAVRALDRVDTLILGGFDRGIDYSGLAKFLSGAAPRNLIFTGEAGERIRKEFERIKRSDQQLFSIEQFDQFIDIALQNTEPGAICLLSPAAASYNEFLNFEMRGKRFRELVLGKSGPAKDSQL